MVIIKKYSLELVKESSCKYDVEKTYTSPSSIVKMFNEVLRLDKKPDEVMALACFDAKLKLIGVFQVSSGSLTSSIVHPREIYKRAMLANAYSIVLCHNHPSGDVTPSREDINVTSRLKQVGDIVGITLIDHIIIGGDNHYSLKEGGDL